MILLITLHTNDIHDIIDKHKIMWGQISLQVSKVHIFLNTQLNLFTLVLRNVAKARLSVPEMETAKLRLLIKLKFLYT